MPNHSKLNGSQYARPVAKCVDVKLVRDWTSDDTCHRVDLLSAWTIIKNHYCAALVGRGVCPINCQACREAIISMFGLDEAKSPKALLTWRAKDRSAAMIERLIEQQKREEEMGFPAVETPEDPLASLFPKKQSDNLFLDLEKDYI